MKKRLKIIAIFLLLGFVLKGWLFRQLTYYQPIKERTIIPLTNKNLQATIQQKLANQTIDLNILINLADDLTNAHLSFTFGKASSNPNKVLQTQKANCIGYAALFNSIMQYILQTKELEGQFASKHLVGHIHFLGFNVHTFVKHPFFKDHDFVEVKEVKTGKVVWIDPSFSDCLGIGRVD